MTLPKEKIKANDVMILLNSRILDGLPKENEEIKDIDLEEVVDHLKI